MPKNLDRILLVLLALSLILSACSQGPSEKDIVGRWQSTTLPDLWIEFRPDMTSTGGKWSLTKDGVKIVNEDGTEHVAVLQEGKLIFAEFATHGVFTKEPAKKQ